jgi:hypothetical protein
MNVVKQGILTVGNNTIFSAFKNKSYKTDSLMFNNSIAYSIDIQRYDSEARNTISLCKLDLDAGDTVFDTTKYPLKPQDKLIITSSVAGTTYLIVLTEM